MDVLLPFLNLKNHQYHNLSYFIIYSAQETTTTTTKVYLFFHFSLLTAVSQPIHNNNIQIKPTQIITKRIKTKKKLFCFVFLKI